MFQTTNQSSIFHSHVRGKEKVIPIAPSLRCDSRGAWSELGEIFHGKLGTLPHRIPIYINLSTILKHS
jgi:hypothetical protein